MSAEVLSVADMLENLTTLVDADSLDEIEVTPDSRLIAHKHQDEQEESGIYWITAGPDDQTLKAIKRTFHSVHAFLRHSFEKVEAGQDPKRFIEGVGTIMVLVGEATQKLEKLGLIFKDRVSDLEEYKNLQEFYKNTVMKGAFTQFAKDIALKEKKEKREEKKEEEVEDRAGVHILNNIDVIKGDLLYELFYLKNEAGHHFYTSDLARNIKLACDFGEFSREYFGDDPLLQIKNWEDKNLQLLATCILKEARGKIKKFYKEAMLFREAPVVVLINDALMALMLASNTRNLIRQFSLKGSHRYFSDFQHFLREILHHRDYQRELLYPSQEPFFVNAVALVKELCYYLFAIGMDNHELKEGVLLLTKLDSIKKGAKLSEIMLASYEHLTQAFANHPSGPVFKALDLIREEESSIFDPVMHANVPEIEALIKENHHEIALLRLACPTMQEIISKAYIVDEFKEYLRSSIFHQEGAHHLIINYQDKTSWKEHARSQALEDLGKQAEFADLVTVVTLSKDSAFYHQTGEYQTLSQSGEFIKQFKEHLMDESTGYYFPDHVKQKLFKGGFTDKLFAHIHKVFFHNQDLLSLEDRQNFIEIAYGFIELKLMELTHCHSLSLTSKDGLDSSVTASVALLVLLKLSAKQQWEKEEIEHVIYLIFGQTMMIRERNIEKRCFDRLLQLVTLLEKVGIGYLESFKSLFQLEFTV